MHNKKWLCQPRSCVSPCFQKLGTIQSGYSFFHVIHFPFSRVCCKWWHFSCYFCITSWLWKSVIMTFQSMPHFCWVCLQSSICSAEPTGSMKIMELQYGEFPRAHHGQIHTLLTQRQRKVFEVEGFRKLSVNSGNPFSHGVVYFSALVTVTPAG